MQPLYFHETLAWAAGAIVGLENTPPLLLHRHGQRVRSGLFGNLSVMNGRNRQGANARRVQGEGEKTKLLDVVVLNQS